MYVGTSRYECCCCIIADIVNHVQVSWKVQIEYMSSRIPFLIQTTNVFEFSHNTQSWQ